MNGQAIEIRGLTKKYGSYRAVDNLTLSLAPGEIFGLLGPNGAGKSTTILMLMGLTEPDEGRISVFGIDPVRNPVEVKKIVGYLPEDVGFYDHMSGLENLIYTARLNGLPVGDAHSAAREMMEKVGLQQEMDKKAGKYSRGMRQRLGLADALIKKPKVIILDEPTLGIDPAGMRSFLELIVHLSREEGLTVLFSSHHLHQVQQVCDRVGIFVKGKLLAEGNINELARSLFATSAYTIEAVLEWNGVTEKEAYTIVQTVEQALKALEGVDKVTLNENRFQIKCSSDLTAHIARTIVSAGAGLTYLNRKEYGLDDIYYKYFEGGEGHE